LLPARLVNAMLGLASAARRLTAEEFEAPAAVLDNRPVVVYAQ